MCVPAKVVHGMNVETLSSETFGCLRTPPSIPPCKFLTGHRLVVEEYSTTSRQEGGLSSPDLNLRDPSGEK